MLPDPALVTAVRRCHADPDPAVRLTALRIRGGVEDSEQDYMAQALADPAVEIQREAIEILRRRVNQGGELRPERIAWLLSLAADGDGEVGSAALAALGGLARRSDAAALAEALPRLRPDTRGRVIAILGNLGASEAIEAIQVEVARPESAVGREAVSALEAIGGARAIGALLGMSGHADVSVRREALRALRGSQPKELFQETGLFAALDDRNFGVRLEAAAALAHLEDTRAVPLLIEARRGGRNGGPRREGRSKLSEVRSIASLAGEALQRFGSRLAISPLMDLLADSGATDNPWLPFHLVLAPIERFAPAGDANFLANALERIRQEARPALLRVFGRLRRSETIPAIGRALAAENLEVVRAAVAALSEIGGSEVFQPLASQLHHTDTQVQRKAIWGLAALKTTKAFATVEKLAQSPEEESQSEALQARATYRAPGAFDAIVARLRPEEAADRRLEAIQLLGRLFEGKTLPHLVPLLKDPHGEIQKKAREAVEQIRFYLEQEEFARKFDIRKGG